MRGCICSFLRTTRAMDRKVPRVPHQRAGIAAQLLRPVRYRNFMSQVLVSVGVSRERLQ
jgi:hypothetical protein